MGCKKMLIGIIVCASLGFSACVPQLPAPETKEEPPIRTETKVHEDTEKKHEALQHVLMYTSYLEDIQEPSLQDELNFVSHYDVGIIGLVEKIHVVLLAMHHRVSVNDLILLKRMLESPQFMKSVEDPLVLFLRKQALQHIVVRLHNGLLAQEVEASLKKNIILQQEIMAHQKQEENLRTQIQQLKDIETIITKREKPPEVKIPEKSSH